VEFVEGVIFPLEYILCVRVCVCNSLKGAIFPEH